MKEIDKPLGISNKAIRRAYYHTINGETGDVFTVEMQSRLREEGYEHFRDRLYIKPDNGNYIFNAKIIDKLRNTLGNV